MKLYITILLLLIPINCNSNVIEVASKYIGINQRDNKEIILKFQKSVNLKGNTIFSWCAAFARYCMDEAKINYPIRSAVAKAYITDKSIKAKHVAKGYIKLNSTKNYLVIWTRGQNTYKGHIGFVVNWDKIKGTTIEGNTTNNKTKQSGFVEKKQRMINDYSDFKIIYFSEL